MKSYEKEIINIDCSNFQSYKSALVPMVLSQMESIGTNKTAEEINLSLNNVLRNKERAKIFIAQNNNEEVLGFAFFNICSGLESGGDYIWINEIYVLPEFRSKGVGASLLSEIESYARENNLKCLLGVTWEENISSKTMFRKMNFSVENTVWISKKL